MSVSLDVLEILAAGCGRTLYHIARRFLLFASWAYPDLVVYIYIAFSNAIIDGVLKAFSPGKGPHRVSIVKHKRGQEL